MKTPHETNGQGVWDWNTGVAGLVRNRDSGRFYSRYQVNGVRTMKALKTDISSVARLKHFDTMADVERQRAAGTRAEAGGGTMDYLLKSALETHEANTELKGKTKTCFRLSVERLETHWKACFKRDLGTMKPEKISGEMAETFANFLHSRAQWRRHKGRRLQRGYGAVTVNVTIEALHRVLRFAKARGFIFAIPFELKSELGQGSILKSEPKKKIQFPDAERIGTVFREMRTVRADLPENQNDLRAYLIARADESADLAEFMAFSGARIQEAVTWVWEDESEKGIVIRGTKTETSCNREVPKIPALAELLQRMRARRLADGRALAGRAFTIKQCREALESACERAGVDRWTHHTLRHLFATRCLEAGVDIPTVSRWLGHADGGALAMKTYGHLRQEHSQAQALKVSF